ncbi:serine hydrolase domain-containing protein [Micromonospora sp. NBC_01813]|uniref:serine hydrolase domain-containing protein n=1 Tax=Micromonospora sp. NBC_01813 TaxID=2975988 RepID=UPI002DDBED8E|nr:serine hydrolase domain-containing protein [Micromonospora sp. NBC_01813]WSA10809.1 beta-lactamase family protein [Micromonospora sp. NBC_01813]
MLVTGAAVLLTIAVALGGTLAGRWTPQLSQLRTGDPELVQRAAPLLTGVRHAASVCYATDEDIRYAHFGSDERKRYEIASLTKTFTGELLADSVARGEVRLDTRVGDLLDLGDAPIADATLQDLATYRSGLGEWGDDTRDDTLRRWWVEDVRAGTVHDIDLPELLDRARQDPLSTRGLFAYSNIGIALLGHALAAAADIDYPTLLRQRLIEPLELVDTRLGTSEYHNRPRGFAENGRRSPPWNLGAYAPAGSGISTIADMCRYAQRLVTADTEEAVEEGLPVARMVADGGDGDGVGLGWYVRRNEDGPVAWKTGRTGGFASMIAIADGRAVVVLSDTASPVDDLVWDLIDRAP